ncbi:MAG: phage tail sheath family protein, partial [bacterium]
MIAAPGLGLAWQQAILEYAGPKGRGDIFAVLETPRHLLTKEARSVKLDAFRWTTANPPYEMPVLETKGSPETAELRFLGYANDELLDRCIPRDDTGFGAAYGPWLIVENPLSTGPHDRYVIAPPSGHVAGVIAGTDLKAGGGVHKAPANEQMLGVAELVTEVSDKEQAPLNTKSINIIRHRPGGGIRIWGARTTAADAQWRYVNVRRLFLFIERSVRDAVNWAVFLPNNALTRRDLATTIRSFLYSLWSQGMLDGAVHTAAYTVKCDPQNNPDEDDGNGILTDDDRV